MECTFRSLERTFRCLECAFRTTERRICPVVITFLFILKHFLVESYRNVSGIYYFCKRICKMMQNT